MEDKFAGAHSCQTQNLRGFIPQLCATISGGSRALCKVCGLFCFGQTTFALYVCVHHGDMFGVPANFHLATTCLAALLNAVCDWSCRQQNAIPLNAIAGTMVCWHPIMFAILLKSPSHSKRLQETAEQIFMEYIKQHGPEPIYPKNFESWPLVRQYLTITNTTYFYIFYMREIHCIHYTHTHVHAYRHTDIETYISSFFLYMYTACIFVASENQAL